MDRAWIRSALIAWAASALVADTALAHPASGIVVTDSGEIHFVHTGQGLARIDAHGKTTIIHKDTGGHWLALDPKGTFALVADNRLFKKVTAADGKTKLLFASGGAPLIVHRDGNLYYGSGYPDGDDTAPGFHTVTRLSPDGKRTLFSPDLKTKLEELNEGVMGLAVGPDGSLFVACPNAILKVKMDGKVTTFAHPVTVKDCDDDLAKDSRTRAYHSPYLRGLDVTEDETVYAAVTGCRCVVKITAGGNVKTVLKSERPWTPTGVALRGQDLFVLEYSNPDKPTGWSPRVLKLAADGKVTILARVGPDDSKAADVPAAFAGAKAGDEREVGGIRLCWCPAGKFTMGSPPNEPERRPGEDQVEVTLTKGFWMGKYEVTQGDWKHVVGKLPGEFTAELPEGDDLPVGNVNFAETEQFCRKLTEKARTAGDLPNEWEFRLPTEAQWEYACRAGTTTATSFGDKLSSKQANFQGKPYNGAEEGPSLKRAAKVGGYPANPWGLHDMHGNTYEWCRDWFHAKLPGGVDPDLYAADSTAQFNRTGDKSRVRRGGAWTDDGWPCRSAFRVRFEPARRYDHIGFRVVAVRS